jgi:glucan phosphoethanolaminetransferase (alkaline phosphatase superfamily)
MKRIADILRIDGFCAYVVWALYAAPTIMIVVWAAKMRSSRSAVAIVITFVLTAYVIAIITRTWRRFFLLQFPVCLLGVGFVAYTVTFGIPPGSALASILAFTSLEEMQGFFGLQQGRLLVLLLGAWSVCYLASAWIAPTGPIFSGRRAFLFRMILILVVPLAAYTVSNPSQLIDGVMLEPVVGSLMFFGGDIPRVKAEMRRASIHKIPYRAHRTGGEEVHILVVGESARRDSWSVYGYGRPTTPYLSSIKGEAIFLQNAVADANFTSWAVPMMLTGMTPDNFDLSGAKGNIFDLAKESGYIALLLENQDPNAAEAAGVGADEMESPIDLSGSATGRRTFDGQLLVAYRREIARSGKARFIGIHMMGSHWKYSNRYPPQFQRFGSPQQPDARPILASSRSSEADMVDTYDNTVLYTDWFLQQVVERARELNVPATVTFFSDHGEDLQLLDGTAGHGNPVYTPHAFEVPAFVWANDAYRRQHPEIIAALKNNAAKEIRSHDVFYTMAELMGISWPGAIASRSFASDNFVPDTMMRHIAGGVSVVRPQPSAVSLAAENKLAASP